MLSLLLLLATGPQMAGPAVQAVPSRPMPPPPSQGGLSMRMLGQPLPGCPSTVMRAADPTAPDAGLMWREGGQPVGHYLLLDRHVNGCPAPLVVNHRVPGSNALGREGGRATPSPR